MRTVVNYIQGVRHELSLVVWPKRKDVVKLTLIVFAISAIVAAYVGGVDLLFVNLVGKLITK